MSRSRYRHQVLWLCLAAAACSSNSSTPAAPAPASSSTPASVPVSLLKLELAATSINGGQSSQGTITLTAAAPPGGVTVTLSSSQAAVSVPPQVIVTASATTATFAIATQAVTQAIDASIHASLGGDSRDAGVHVVPAPDLVALELLSPNVSSAGQVAGNVRISAPPVQAIDVALSSDNAAVTVPPTVSVPQGATSATFRMTVQAVSAHTVIHITARLGATSRSAIQQLTPLTLDTYFSYTSDPGDFIGGGQSARLSPPARPISAGVRCDLNWFVAQVGPALNTWNISMNAPPGQEMDYGTYANATGNPRVRGRASLSVYGNGHGCNTSTGSFTVLEIGWGPNNTVVRFKATFEQHCEGASAALRGEISVGSPPYFDNNMACFISSAALAPRVFLSPPDARRVP